MTSERSCQLSSYYYSSVGQSSPPHFVQPIDFGKNAWIKGHTISSAQRKSRNSNRNPFCDKAEVVCMYSPQQHSTLNMFCRPLATVRRRNWSIITVPSSRVFSPASSSRAACASQCPLHISRHRRSQTPVASLRSNRDSEPALASTTEIADSRSCLRLPPCLAWIPHTFPATLLRCRLLQPEPHRSSRGGLRTPSKLLSPTA